MSDMNDQNEALKYDALAVGSLMSSNYFAQGQRDDLLQDKARFMRACEMFFDNANDYKLAAFCLKTGAIGFIHANDDQNLKEVWAMLSREAIPDDVKDRIAAALDLALNPPPRPKPSAKAPRPTNVYLMLNGRNGFHKIGKSNNPKVREHTLQSQEPEVSLLRSWKGFDGDEKFLHERYAEHRVRGEWFNLKPETVEELCSIMEARSA